MALQVTRAGLQERDEYYFGNHTEHLILLNGSDALTDTSTIAQFIALEPAESDGYAREAVNLTGWDWDSGSSAVKCVTVTGTYTASVSGTIQFDASACLVGGSANANQEVTTIAANLLTSTAHGLSAGDKVSFSSDGTLPTGLTAATVYYVLASGLTTDAFKVSATDGGSEVAIGTSWTGSLLLRYCNGTLFCWEQRPDDGLGNRTYTINAGQSHSVDFQLGSKVGA